ncbi:MAG: hypothetical protein KC931_25570, partial [Candidatus Omnitrophica bacterium]|nr:hypothetical protein [Candidatus Omnitrophota bacterium]
MQQIATCLVVYGVSFLGPMILAEEEDDVFENEDPQPWYRPSLTLEGDIEYTSEKQGPEHQEEWTFDEITLELETDPWESEISIQYETKGAKRGFHVEDLWVKVGTGWELPGWLMVGRTSLPFADFDSLFIEDPLGITLGEIDEEALMLGTESE